MPLQEKNASVVLQTQTSEITVEKYRLKGACETVKGQTEKLEPQPSIKAIPADGSNIGKACGLSCRNMHTRDSQKSMGSRPMGATTRGPIAHWITTGVESERYRVRDP